MPLLKNGNKRAKGGARKGAGRKPKAATALRLKLAEHGAEEAEFAFSLTCFWMRDDDLPLDFRLACATQVMDRVLGKPKQAVAHEGQGGGPIQHTITEVVVEHTASE